MGWMFTAVPTASQALMFDLLKFPSEHKATDVTE